MAMTLMCAAYIKNLCWKSWRWRVWKVYNSIMIIFVLGWDFLHAVVSSNYG